MAMNYMLTQSASVITECKDTSERIDLYLPFCLYIKPIARLNITIALAPPKTPGQAPPYAEILDKLRKHVQPEFDFTYLRIAKATLEFIRCEAEIENKSNLKALLTKLDGSVLKLISTYTDVLKVRAAEAKLTYPARHDWETYYSNPDVPSEQWEKPDTVHINDLPIKWFSDRTRGDLTRPSENIVREVFSIFGEIRMIDIPMLSTSSSSSASSTSPKPEIFEVYIQFKDYIGFVKAMDTFRGMKMLYADATEAYSANIRVDFDRTRHLSDKELKKREIEKLKAIEMEKIRNAQLEKEKEKENKQKEIANFRAMLEQASGGDGEKEKSKEQRRREREEIRRQKCLVKKQQEEAKKFELKIALEERKMLIAQRKLESMRLLEELFNRVKVVVAQEEMAKREKELSVEREKRILEEANLEQAKKMRIEQEGAELNEKIRRNIERHQKEAEEAAERAFLLGENGEFELRKTTVLSSGGGSGGGGGGGAADSSPDGAGAQILPRSIILSNPAAAHLHANTTPRRLYDDEDGAGDNSNSSSNLTSLSKSGNEQQQQQQQQQHKQNTSNTSSNNIGAIETVDGEKSNDGDASQHSQL